MAYSLKYAFNSSTNSYSVTEGVNITASDKVVIPDTYKGPNGSHPVTSIGDNAFKFCSSLTSVTIGNSVTSIGYSAFAHCSSLTSITIPNSVINIGTYTFAFCSSLTSVTIGSGVTSIGDSVFENCGSLKQLILFRQTPPTLASSAIPTTIQSIYVQQSSKAAYQAAEDWVAYKTKIVSDNLYLSFVRFNQKNKEYIDNSDSLLANSLMGIMGSGVQGTGNPPLQGYSKNKGTIEERLTKLGFKQLPADRNITMYVSGAALNGSNVRLLRSGTTREGNRTQVSLSASFTGTAVVSPMIDFFGHGYQAISNVVIPEEYRPASTSTCAFDYQLQYVYTNGFSVNVHACMNCTIYGADTENAGKIALQIVPPNPSGLSYILDRVNIISSTSQTNTGYQSKAL